MKNEPTPKQLKEIYAEILFLQAKFLDLKNKIKNIKT